MGIATALTLTTVGTIATGLVDLVAGYSVLLGGLCSVLPNAIFARRIFGSVHKGGALNKHTDGPGNGSSARGASRPVAESACAQTDGLEADPSEVVGSMMRAEVGKLVSVVGLLALTFTVVEPLYTPALIGAFGVVHLTSSIVTLWKAQGRRPGRAAAREQELASEADGLDGQQ